MFGKLGLEPSLERINLFFLFGFDHLVYAQALAILILLSVLSGFAPRVMGVLHWWVAFSFQQAGSVLEGGDQVASILTFLLIPVTLLDNRLNHWSTTPKTPSLYKSYVGNVFLTVIRLQMSVLYFHAAVEKLYKSDEWSNGTALYYFSNNPLFGFPDWLTPISSKIMSEAVLVSSFTWGAMIFELLLFGALFMSDRKRKWLLPFAVIFH